MLCWYDVKKAMRELRVGEFQIPWTAGLGVLAPIKILDWQTLY